MGVAFFDLDRTLIDCNSALLYARWERRRGAITRTQLLRSAGWMVLYHLSLSDMEKAFAKAVDHFKGTPWSELEARTREWFVKDVAHRLQPGAVEALRHHRAAGDQLVLLSSTSCWVAAYATELFMLDDWLANQFPADPDGNLTGDYERPLCYGPGKRVLAERWARERGVSLDDAIFYTDSYSDVAMLEFVDHPRVVNPDPRLRRHARKRGWPVLDWRTSGDALAVSASRRGAQALRRGQRVG